MTIRPFQLPHDLDLMHSLVMEGFEYPDHPEWSVRPDEKESMADGLQAAKRMWPVLRVLQIFSPVFRDALRGFLYEEDGKPVGLINFMRQRDEPEWYVANVTVLPAHRRKGIARQLVDASIAELRNRQAKTALLEVVDENLPAVQLYQSLGFEIYSGSVEMDLAAGAAVPEPSLPSGWTLTPVRLFDWQTNFELAKRITPADVARYEPPMEKRFRSGVLRPVVGTLMNRLGGSASKRFALRSSQGEVAGFIWVGYRLRAGGVNYAEISLDPAHPELASFLVAHALRTIQSLSPGRNIQLLIEQWQPAVVEAARALGCTVRLHDYRMGYKFK